MIETIKKNWVSIFVGGIIVILIVSAILRALAPPIVNIPQAPTYTQSNLYNTQTTFQNITFTGTKIDVPIQMTVAKMANTAITESSFLSQLESDFQLTPIPNATDVWTGPTYSLSKTEANDYYSLTNNNIASSSGQVVNKDQAVTTAQNFMKKYAPGIQLQLVDSKVVYYTADFEPQVTTADKADWVFLPFSYQVDGIPVFYQNQREYPFEFVIDAQQNIQKFSFYAFFIQITPIQQQPTISIDQAIKNINVGQASLISMQAVDPTVTDISQIKSANLNTVSLEYRVDPTSSFVYPFYRFAGSATNTEGSPITVEIITPAVKTVSQQ